MKKLANFCLSLFGIGAINITAVVIVNIITPAKHTHLELNSSNVVIGVIITVMIGAVGLILKKLSKKYAS